MPYFQNVYESEFIGALLLSDRQFNLSFKIKANRNTSVIMRPWNNEPYNTVANTTLTFNVSIDSGKNYFVIPVSLTSSATLSAYQVVTDLNADTAFAAYFVASLEAGLVTVKARYRRENFKAYINNTSAETILKFNRWCGVAELPSYFERHTIANRLTYTDSLGALVKLTQPTDNTIITDAGLSTTAKADYELLAGRSGLFNFQKITVDGSDRITKIIEYPAGAKAGDFCRMIDYTYTGANTNPSQITETPYTLTNSDLVTPP
jgi:hypothetical protein